MAANISTVLGGNNNCLITTTFFLYMPVKTYVHGSIGSRECIRNSLHAWTVNGNGARMGYVNSIEELSSVFHSQVLVSRQNQSALYKEHRKYVNLEKLRHAFYVTTADATYKICSAMGKNGNFFTNFSGFIAKGGDRGIICTKECHDVLPSADDHQITTLIREANVDIQRALDARRHSGDDTPLTGTADFKRGSEELMRELLKFQHVSIIQGFERSYNEAFYALMSDLATYYYDSLFQASSFFREMAKGNEGSYHLLPGPAIKLAPLDGTATEEDEDFYREVQKARDSYEDDLLFISTEVEEARDSCEDKLLSSYNEDEEARDCYEDELPSFSDLKIDTSISSSWYPAAD